MAFQAYALFMAPKSPIQNAKPFDADLAKGQTDLIAKNTSTDHPLTKWFRILSWEYEAAAKVDYSVGTGVGNVQQGVLRLLKYYGPLSPVLTKAMGTRGNFDLQLDVVSHAGHDKPIIFSTVIIRTAFIQKIDCFTGGGGFSSGTALAGASGDAAAATANNTGLASFNVRAGHDTNELESLEIAFQGIQILYTGKLGKDAKSDCTDSFANR